MCCRYYMEESPELKPFVDAAGRSSLTEKMTSVLARPLTVSGDVRPADIAPVLAPDRYGRRSVFPMVWGFTGKNTIIFNARSETASQKPTFRESWERRRCIIPASYYYEWQHFTDPEGKTKKGDRYMIQPEGSSVALLAGLYRLEETEGVLLPHFTILTREPPEELRIIHDRMPVILDPDIVPVWLDPGSDLSLIQEAAETSRMDMVFEKA